MQAAKTQVRNRSNEKAEATFLRLIEADPSKDMAYCDLAVFYARLSP